MKILCNVRFMGGWGALVSPLGFVYSIKIGFSIGPANLIDLNDIFSGFSIGPTKPYWAYEKAKDVAFHF